MKKLMFVLGFVIIFFIPLVVTYASEGDFNCSVQGTGNATQFIDTTITLKILLVDFQIQ